MEKFLIADNLLRDKKLEEAMELFLQSMEEEPEARPYCYYALAEIANEANEPEKAYELYYQAFGVMPNITSKLFPKEHKSYKYIFEGIRPEKRREDCPLCGKICSPRWCYCLAEGHGYNYSINPIRIWMYCEPCHHLFARDFPEKIFLNNKESRKIEHQRFSLYSDILINISRYAQGTSFFEIGFGAGEFLLAAREMGYDVFGIDVIDKHVRQIKELYKLENNVETADFNEYESAKKYDVIIMGDVLEHVSDPVKAIEKAESLLSDDGALWISTPNFDSAVSVIYGHKEPMRREQYHINYFSRESLLALLERFNLVAVEYRISRSYNGSMEVIALKKSRFE